MINWQFLNKIRIIPEHLQNVLVVFELNESLICSDVHNYCINPDHQKEIYFFNILRTIGRLQLPLNGNLLIGN